MNGKKEIIFAFYLKLQCVQTQTSKNTKNECRRNPCWPQWEQLLTATTTTDCTTAVQTTQFWPVWVTTGQCGTLYSLPHWSLWLQLCHFCSFMEHLFFLSSLFNWMSFYHVCFLVLLWPQWGSTKFLVLYRKKGLPISYLDSSEVIKVKIETCMRCFALTAAWQGNSYNTLKCHHKVQQYEGYCGLFGVKYQVVL